MNNLQGGEDVFMGGSDGGSVGYIGGAQSKTRKKMFKEHHCSPGESDVMGSCLDDDIVTVSYTHLTLPTNREV